MRSLLRTIFVADATYRASLEQIKAHPVFRRIGDWDTVLSYGLEPPFVPDQACAYHNCNEKAQVRQRDAQGDQTDLAKFAFLDNNPYNIGQGEIHGSDSDQRHI